MIWKTAHAPVPEIPADPTATLIYHPNATVTLTLDDDSELVCAVLTIFPAGEHKYIISAVVRTAKPGR